MMYWSEAAMIMFSCVAVNHLGLVAAIEDIVRRPLPVINCPKCLTFWSVLAYMMSHVGLDDIPKSVAASFLFAYLSLWLQLLLAFTDRLYNYLYDKIHSTAGTANDGT